ncbi:MAG: tRNA (adenosine(37)-N6)-dimethylallyltransferase MiaA [Bacteroidetes bacterium]|nr:tRNA (adenosine(37)-N6)-dimethylallyltransferase MiaA [Bacteroidota bacterium]
MTTDPFLLVIAGPTAAGKTSLAIQLAKHFHTEIISADSRQVYREMVIGTAAPTSEEMNGVNHHLVGHLSVEDTYNAWCYARDASDILKKLFDKHQIVILVGGSGLYIRALCEGIDPLPGADAQIRESLGTLLNEQGITALQQKLQTLDPVYCQKVDLANPVRLIRALEVCQLTGQPYSSLIKKSKEPRWFRYIKVGLSLPREELSHRIGVRVEEMMKQGLLEEVRSLVDRKHLNALNTVGYKELFAYLDGVFSLEKAVEVIKSHTRQYAKRQMTWFRKDQEITWFQPHQLQEIIQFIERSTKLR